MAALTKVATFGVFATFQLMLASVPVYGAETTHRASVAGYLTAALLVSTIAGQLSTPGLLRRLPSAAVMSAGAGLSGLSCLVALIWVNGTAVLFIGQAVRGCGFGILSVASAAALVSDIPSDQRRAGMGRYALLTGVPGVVMAPLGLLLMEHASMRVLALTGLVLSAGGTPGLVAVRKAGRLAAGGKLATHRLRQPMVIWLYAFSFLGASAAWMTFVTYMPLAYLRFGHGFTAGCLFCIACVRAAARWLAARADSLGTPRALAAVVALGLVGSAWLPVIGRGSLLIGGIVLGTGLGVFHTGVYLAMLKSTRSSRFHAVGVIWNVCIESGGLLGTFIAGLAASRGGAVAGLWVIPAFLLIAALAVAWLAATASRVHPNRCATAEDLV